MLIPLLKGFGTGASLIIAIGAQNAFVLSQGVRKNHILVIPLVCAICDALLITLGVTGLGTLIASNPRLSMAAGIGGAAFLLVYGFNAFRSALRGGSLKATQETTGSLKAAVIMTLAVTLLNPHVYIDTVILLGSVASQFSLSDRGLFAAGACIASFIWFFSLSLGSSMLAPLFEKEIAWRILDTTVGIVMWAIAASLIVGLL